MWIHSYTLIYVYLPVYWIVNRGIVFSCGFTISTILLKHIRGVGLKLELFYDKIQLLAKINTVDKVLKI